MLFSEEAATGAGSESDSDAATKSGGGEPGDDKQALARLAEQRDAARREQREAAKELTTLRERLTELEGKDKSDVERLTAERDKLKTDLDSREMRLRELAIRTALMQAATKSGARYPELIVDRLSSQADLDDDLTVTNAETLVTTAKREYPDLFRVVDGKANGGDRDSGTDTSSLRGQSRLAHAHAQRSRA
jgi:hypothetical protein